VSGWEKTKEEHEYTSTGIKFWRHQAQMEEFARPIDGSPRNTVISTHVSPEGECNLKCSYCSVNYRTTHSRIPLNVVKKYVEDLMTRGLRAVILTGGGEPTIYPHFNELVQWLKKEKGLSVALITNGTTSKKILPETLACFSWIRVSINFFRGWEDKISIDTTHLNSECVVGCSLIYTSEHIGGIEFFEKASEVADSCGARYVRVLPNCLLEQEQLIQQHVSLREVLKQYPDKRFFQQYKVHGAPKASICHQAYFRPYLSEEPSVIDGKSGAVFPCDSVVLNDSLTRFSKEYQLCKPEDILDFIDGKIEQVFDPRELCTGCVFTDNVNMLENWKVSGVNRFAEFPNPLKHEEFV
jgi:organic radical activating enzyme